MEQEQTRQPEQEQEQEEEIQLDLADALFDAKINHNCDYAWIVLTGKRHQHIAGHRVEIHSDRFHPGMYTVKQFNENGVEVYKGTPYTTDEISTLGVSYGPLGWKAGEQEFRPGE